MMASSLLTPEFLTLSARLGKDPLQIQGAGGNTSVKDGTVMWVKASGTELAHALTRNIFVKVLLDTARPATEGSGPAGADDPAPARPPGLRPSIETTFHASLEQAYVVHTHSIATLVHAISPDGRKNLAKKLDGLPHIQVPYTKPGPDLTRAILKRIKAETRVIILQNHGLVCCGDTVDEVRTLIDRVEHRLIMPPRDMAGVMPDREARTGYVWWPASWLAQDTHVASRVLGGSYYPDHVVFLGRSLPEADCPGSPPVILEAGVGVLVRQDATPAQIAMLQCLTDIFQRMPPDWSLEAIGPAAEADLLDWDAERYRQQLANVQ